MAEGSNPVGNTGTRRRSQRVLMQVPVRVRGADPQGKSFEEFTDTLAINAHGALVLLTQRIVTGGVVYLRHQTTGEEQECHIVFLGPVRGGKAEIGLEFSSARPTFWRVAFPPEDWSSKHPEARTVSSARPQQQR